VDALREQAGEWSPLQPWHPDTLEAMAGVAAATAAQGRWAEAEAGLRGLLALRERFLGAEHADTLETRLASLGLASLSRAGKAGRPGGRAGPADPRQAERGSSQRVPEAGEAEAKDGAQRGGGDGGDGAAGASAAACGVMDALWGDLQGLGRLQELQLLGMGDLGWEARIRLTSNALGASCQCLQRLDLR
jgi:hypothetical protein